MSESDELERIRESKRERLQEGSEDADAANPGAPDEPVHVEGADHLADLTEQYDVVLADFYADWCGPCKMLEPIVTDLAAETDAAVAKVDVDQYQHLAGQYGVQGVPTLVLFGDGEPVERLVGVRDKATLAGLVQQYA